VSSPGIRERCRWDTGRSFAPTLHTPALPHSAAPFHENENSACRHRPGHSPTAILSLMAGRALRSWELVLQRGLETTAANAVESVADRMQADLGQD